MSVMGIFQQTRASVEAVVEVAQRSRTIVAQQSGFQEDTLMSDDAELVKAGVEGATAAAIVPFTDLISRLFGRAADEGGAMLGEVVHDFGNELRERMRARRLRLFGKTQEFLTIEAATAKQVELKLLIPLLENGSLEEDDGLQDRWAALLARISTGLRIPGAVEILKQLTSDDVEFLQLCYDFVHNIETSTWRKEVEAAVAIQQMPPPPPFDPSKYDLTPALNESKQQIARRLNHIWLHTGRHGQPDEFYVLLDNVIRLGLVSSSEEPRLTRIGYRIISACQIPR
jgi:Abortive infection alpha